MVDKTPVDLPTGYSVNGNHLHLGNLDLAALADEYLTRAGLEDAPLTIRYMPRVRENFRKAEEAFAAASRATGFAAKIELAFASKANPNRAMIHTVLDAGADYECSSRVDVTIIRHAIAQGWLTPDRLIIANGFKTPGYANELIALAREGHPGVIPVFDALEEAMYFAAHGVPMTVGVRYRVPGRGDRFGMEEPEMLEAANVIAEAPNLTLKLFHAIQQYPALNNPAHFEHLHNALKVFARLRADHPSLAYFDLGGGLPADLAEPDDLEEWMTEVQRLVMEVCGAVHPPNLVVESGRYLAGAHQMYAFRVLRVKTVDDMPQYVIGGGIMSNVPDAWALELNFPVAPLNYWDAPFQQVKLAGLTCDGDDVYPHKAREYIMLPSHTEGLLIGFLDVGAYQDLLGGEGGAKHCLLSEGATIIIGDDPANPSDITYYPPQETASVLENLGYKL
jgi:arginine decarboxylase